MKQKVSTPVAVVIILVALAVFGFYARQVWLAPPDIELARNANKSGRHGGPMGPGPAPSKAGPPVASPPGKPIDHKPKAPQKIEKTSDEPIIKSAEETDKKKPATSN